MDLILTNSDPAEAVIESFGRYRYMKNKQRKQSTKTSKNSIIFIHFYFFIFDIFNYSSLFGLFFLATPKMKQVRFSCLSEEHDINTKLRRTEQFLREGRPVRVAAIFKRFVLLFYC